MPLLAVATLGCKVNQVDSAYLEQKFKEAGYSVVDWPGPADICIINTCTVTGRADRQSRQMVHRARRSNPQAFIVVTGCSPMLGEKQSHAYKDANLVCGNLEKSELWELVRKARPSERGVQIGDIFRATAVEAGGAVSMAGRVRAFLKVQDGCSFGCAYCIVPSVRGPSRSVPMIEALKSAGDLTKAGFLEVVLTGIHLGTYGLDLHPPADLFELCHSILTDTKVGRLRLSSVEPGEVTPELIALMSRETRFCNHLHIPLQSGSDRVLQAMHRSYRVADYEDLAFRCRAQVPDITLGADLLVGFPGETDSDFAETVAALNRLRLPHLHVFPYSDRPGTFSTALPDKVPAGQIAERVKLVREIALRHQRAHRLAQVGRRLPVLVEQVDALGQGRGLSRNYLPTIVQPTLPVGTEAEVRITALNEQGNLIGRPD